MNLSLEARIFQMWFAIVVFSKHVIFPNKFNNQTNFACQKKLDFDCISNHF